ncbi:O-antigen ligase family protein [Maioricimonas sp. JC845]|uniref:O-antigen ligase family protein n=1 Tax=Maioricimonas sp. JC845 TaxID=3232138 RepID=UPI00345A2007
MQRLLIIPMFLYVLLTGLAFGVNPIIGTALIVAPVLAFVVFRYPEMSLISICFFIPFDRLTIILPQAGLTITKILILFTLAAWAVRVLLHRDEYALLAFVNQPTTLFVLAYFAIIVIGVSQAKDIDMSMFFITKRLSLIIFYFLIVNLLRSMKAVNRSINAMLIASVFICLIGLYEFLTGNQFLPRTVRGSELAMTFEGSARIQACAGHSNFHSAILVLLLPFLLMRFEQVHTVGRKVILGGVVLLYVINIFGTNTRQGMLCMLTAFAGTYLLQKVRHRGRKITLGVTAGAIALAVFAMIPGKVDVSRYSGQSGLKSVEYRLAWIEMSWEMIKDRPVLGVGTGNYYSEYSRYRRFASTMATPKRVVNHNGIMQIWAENGTIGMLILLALLGSPLYVLVRTIRITDDDDCRASSTAVLISHCNYILLIGIIPMLEHEVGWIVLALSTALGNIGMGRVHRTSLLEAPSRPHPALPHKPATAPKLGPAAG